MSNTSKGRAQKGSKYMMQLAASPLLQQILNKKLEDELVWLSPVEESNYEEYQLSEDEACKFLGLSLKKNLFNFWPRRQPQWDGIAMGKGHNTLYLFEAKSHLIETKTNCSASSDESKKTIRNTISDVANKIYQVSDKDVIESYWMNENYQLANRLTFLQKMKDLSKSSMFYEDVKLVLLNFIKDPTWDDKEQVETCEQWTKHYDAIYKRMGITREQVEKEGVIEINYSAPYIF